ncbi:M1 family metallopeptidase [Bailinhaonella thermotolerans]|uniref:Aminopeptidase N n=1 Tax=Bailinhaonella thermotolerans TaxID=1070861 RepID=A0A3A4AUQ7_9ACTN|nr:M1 family metallopeptidase [Bailinhaonella thermotolerans]RJL33325.1 M1 family peptidase [Bailinhaonella thermotolerans]
MRPLTLRALALVLLGVVPLACTGAEPEPPATTSPVPTARDTLTPGAGTVGEAGIGDPDFPRDGNGGYDVAHYALKLSYEPSRKRLEGTADVRARALQDLSRFNLDLRGFTVAQVQVDGADARFERDGTELIVTPAATLRKDAAFTVRVRYAGRPDAIEDPGNLGTYGFNFTPDGAFVTSQPSGARTWFPGNDHPADKATFDFEITVPEGLTVLANGEMAGRPRTASGRTTFVWRERNPMATYLATMTLGRFHLKEGRTASGIPNVAAVDPRFKGSLNRLYDLSGKITDYWAEKFGPYPFGSTGGVVDDFDAGYALENQTKPMYGGFDPYDSIIAHELAHQWFGDSLSIRRWRDLWLNEGFATYAEWLWGEHANGEPAETQFKLAYETASQGMWRYPPGVARPKDLFNNSVYTRGAMTLHALRKRVGDDTFFDTLRTWANDHKYGHVTTEEFIALAERKAGRQLDDLFDAWLFQPRKPRL